MKKTNPKCRQFRVQKNILGPVTFFNKIPKIGTHSNQGFRGGGVRIKVKTIPTIAIVSAISTQNKNHQKMEKSTFSKV